jgi:hypothetical protein
MRSVNRLLAAAALAALSACGNYSTEDLRFALALPLRNDLQVAVPTPAAAAGALGTCATRPADAWLKAKPASDGINAGVDWILELVDRVRAISPSHREADRREWGPFPDARHPGVEVRVVMTRSWPAGADGPPAFAYAFEARPVGSADWTTIIDGTFVGASAEAGTGTIAVWFDRITTLQMQDASTPTGVAIVAYDRASEPRTTELRLKDTSQGGFGLDRFDYAWAGYVDGSGRFVFAVPKDFNVWTMDAGFDAAGRGRGRGTFRGIFTVYQVDECWDADACLVYVDDPANVSCPAGTGSCSLGSLAACPAVTSGPF